MPTANHEINVEHSAINKLLQDYFDGLYQGDIERLAKVFHPDARYVCASHGEWLHLAMPDYFKRVQQRVAPAENSERRRDRVLYVDTAGPETAFAKVNCSIGNRYFTDYLSLIFTAGRWQIIAKVFHFEPIASATTD